ncbi:hypothetical protein [Allosphingosinicella deserti]|uniref:Uncharacterized protein n=1 Tax=Allosphingosinicella deserti TaxID=2116704 RepID=A0A2P7QW57_9SPHN|nr:hypothetical protein [Sphingomonas deserti]PSJ42195.1 hypothetical protein C7I55_08145 [Sphingomonas deserti]
MTRINTTDQILLVLRERLRGLNQNRSPAAAPGLSATPSPMARLQTLRAAEGMPREELRKTLVRALLAEQFGDGLASDPAFQAVCDDVFRIIGETPEGRDLLERAAGQVGI